MVTRQPGYESYAVLHTGRLCENVRENPEESFRRIITQNLIKIIAEEQEEKSKDPQKNGLISVVVVVVVIVMVVVVV